MIKCNYIQNIRQEWLSTPIIGPSSSFILRSRENICISVAVVYYVYLYIGLLLYSIIHNPNSTIQYCWTTSSSLSRLILFTKFTFLSSSGLVFFRCFGRLVSAYSNKCGGLRCALSPVWDRPLGVKSVRASRPEDGLGINETYVPVQILHVLFGEENYLCFFFVEL